MGERVERNERERERERSEALKGAAAVVCYTESGADRALDCCCALVALQSRNNMHQKVRPAI
jgi:hypothetical protein